MARTRAEILQQDILTLGSDSGGLLTDFQPSSANFALVQALSQFKGEIEQSLEIETLRQAIATAEGADLDLLARLRPGLLRLGATKGAVIQYFKGSIGSVIPIGTKVKHATSGVQFETLREATITAGDVGGWIKVEARATTAGSAGRVSPYSLNRFVTTAPAGITATKNMMNSYGAFDRESDNDFRARLYSSAGTVSVETTAAFDSLIKQLDNEAWLTAINHTIDTAYCYILRRSAAPLSGPEKTDLASAIQKRLRIQRGLSVVVDDLPAVDIEVSISAVLKNGFTPATALPLIADELDAAFGLRAWTMGQESLDQATIIAAIVRSGTIQNLDEAALIPEGDVYIGSAAYPRVISLSLNTDSGSESANPNWYLVL